MSERVHVSRSVPNSSHRRAAELLSDSFSFPREEEDDNGLNRCMLVGHSCGRAYTLSHILELAVRLL